MKFYKQELFSSFMGAALFIADSVNDGWIINKNDLPNYVGFSYYVSLVRDDEPVVKLTRAETLVKARAVRAAKNVKNTGEQEV